MKLVLTTFIFLLVSISYSQRYDEFRDSLLREKVQEYHIKTVTIKHEYDGKAYLYRIQHYDPKGNVTDWYMAYGLGLDRRGYRFDSLGRLTYDFGYVDSDTSKINSSTRYFYIDSSYYYTEIRHQDDQLYQINHYRTTWSGDTTWVEHLLEYATQDYVIKKFTRDITYGDTLRVSESIRYGADGIKNIETYYYLNVRGDSGQVIKTIGTYTIDHKSVDHDSYLLAYNDENSFYKKQLAGAFRYKKGDIITYLVYNAKGQLIQDGHRSNGMETFEYNEAGQLVKTTRWSAPGYSMESLVCVETGYAIYTYDNRGLPVSMTWHQLKDGREETFFYEYE